jgi:hypothetical protein
MRLQLTIALALAAIPARADDRVDTSFTYFLERRPEGSSLSVYRPQFDFGLDLGSIFSLGAGYEADVVSGATPSVYAPQAPGRVDAVTAASQFSDTRHSGHAVLGMTGARSSLSAGYRYSTERDYRSHEITVTGSVDLAGKNTTFGLAYTRNIDQVCDFDNGDAEPLSRRPLSGQNPCFTDDMTARTVARSLGIDTAQATLTQVVTPTLVLQVGLFGQIAQGFQGNPYRRVRVFDVSPQENVPALRDRGALFLRGNLALPGAHAAASLFVRAYADTWGIVSGDVEADYHQYLGPHLLVRLRGRVYQQTGASFFKTADEYALMGPAGRYFTGDREHAPFRDVLGGAKLSYIVTPPAGQSVLGVFNDLDFHIGAQVIWYQPLEDGEPAVFAGGPFPDVVVSEVGLLLRY